jgi:hypothetical protein
MELKDRVVVIDEKNMAVLSYLYGEMNIDDLGKVVNKHLCACLDEIEEDLTMANRVPHCSECEYLKCVDYMYKNYYCDHEYRTDDMGKVGVDNPPETSPAWCPKRAKLNIMGGLNNGR